MCVENNTFRNVENSLNFKERLAFNGWDPKQPENSKTTVLSSFSNTELFQFVCVYTFYEKSNNDVMFQLIKYQYE